MKYKVKTLLIVIVLGFVLLFVFITPKDKITLSSGAVIEYIKRASSRFAVKNPIIPW
jgi:hypothetical protein